MGAVGIILDEPLIQILLKLIQCPVDLLSEGDLVKLLKDCLVEPFADPVGLRALGLGFGVLDIIDGQVQLIIMTIKPATVLRTAIGEDPKDRHTVIFKKRQDPVVQKICGGSGCFHVIELREPYFGVGVHKALLIDASHTFQSTHIKRILGSEVPGMGAFDFAGDFIALLLC